MKTIFSSKSGFIVALILAFAASVCCHPAAAQSCPANSSISISSFPNTFYPPNQTNLAAGATKIKLSAATQGSDDINPGDILLVIQMQGAQINSTNTSSYGDGTGVGTGYLTNSNMIAGNMEYVIASNSIPASSGGTLNITTGLTNSYKNAPFGTDGQYSYQVIRVPIYYDLLLSATITAPRWDGATGGVVVLYATHDINLNSWTIDASGLGFRGGGGRAFSGSGSGSSADYITSSSQNANGGKGEGIAGTPKYLNHNNSFLDVSSTEGYPNGSYGKGAPANGGGGGTDGNPANNNDENTGGGGGANGGAGGGGGNAWSSGTPSGGRGGSVFSQASASDLVMGGGGGAGTTNNGTGTPGNGFASSGAAGGGIIIIIAGHSITGSGTIKSNGSAAGSSVLNDGSGGGGAGGSILIYSNNGVTSNIIAQAKGGNGGSNEVLSGPAHGPGGGGGGGIIFSNSTLKTGSSVAGGSAGTTAKLTTNYGATAGSTGQMVTTMSASSMAQVPLSCVVLPVTFLDVIARQDNGINHITWEVAQEAGTVEYVIEKSQDGQQFSDLDHIPYKVSVATSNKYEYMDNNSTAGTVYYRIREVDGSGGTTYSKIVTVRTTGLGGKLTVYPNPVRSTATVSFVSLNTTTVNLRLFDGKGSQVWQQQYRASTGQNTVSLDCTSTLPNGMYIFQCNDGLKPEYIQIMVNH